MISCLSITEMNCCRKKTNTIYFLSFLDDQPFVMCHAQQAKGLIEIEEDLH